MRGQGGHSTLKRMGLLDETGKPTELYGRWIRWASQVYCRQNYALQGWDHVGKVLLQLLDDGMPQGIETPAQAEKWLFTRVKTQHTTQRRAYDNRRRDWAASAQLMEHGQPQTATPLTEVSDDRDSQVKADDILNDAVLFSDDGARIALPPADAESAKIFQVFQSELAVQAPELSELLIEIINRTMPEELVPEISDLALNRRLSKLVKRLKDHFTLHRKKPNAGGNEDVG